MRLVFGLKTRFNLCGRCTLRKIEQPVESRISSAILKPEEKQPHVQYVIGLNSR